MKRLNKALLNHLPVKTYSRTCDCGKVLVLTEQNDQRASGGKSLEFEWKKGAFTASCVLSTFPCPECGTTIQWNDGKWAVPPNPTT